MLSSMVLDIYNWTGDKDLVKKSLPALLKEHEFWNSGNEGLTRYLLYLMVFLSLVLIISLRYARFGLVDFKV